MWNFDDVSSILTCDNNSTLFLRMLGLCQLFAPMKIQMYRYICIKFFLKQHRKTMEHKSRLILIINSYVSVWGQSVYICCSIAASKPFASEWSQTTLYGWKKQFWKTYISVSQRSVPNTAMIINSSVQKISSFGYFDFFNSSFISCVTVEQTILKLFLLVFEDLWVAYTLFITNVVCYYTSY